MIYEIELPIESYKQYLIKSYDLIEEIMTAYQKDTMFLDWADQFEKEMFHSGYLSFNYDINEEIIIWWHSSALISIVSILEKWIQEFCIRKDDTYKKRVEKFKKDFQLGKDVSYVEVLWEYIINQNWITESLIIKEQWNDFKRYIYLRNCSIHKSWFKISIEEFSKNNLIKICDDLKIFLHYLFNNWESWNVLDELVDD